MKKSLFCALLALLLVLSCMPAALAESVCSCACGAVSDGVSASPDGEADPLDPFILTLPEPEDPLSALEYTQEIVVDDYHIFIPSEFSNDSSDNGSSSIDYYSSSFDVSIAIYHDSRDSWRSYLNYTGIDDCREALDRISYSREYIPVRVDECIGALVLKPVDESFWADLYVTNRKQTLNITVFSDTEERARKLMAGILEHIVAPLQPIEPPQE